MSDIMNALRQPFSSTLVKKNYRGYDYIPPEHVIDRLNDVLGSSWSFEIVLIETIENEVICTGRLFFEGYYRQGIGTDTIVRKTNDGKAMVDPVGKAYKSAASNCLKLCARLFGVANQLWGGAEFPETYSNEGIEETTPKEAIPFMDTKTGRDYHASFETAAKMIDPISFLEILQKFGYEDTNEITTEEQARKVQAAMREHVRAEKAKTVA